MTTEDPSLRHIGTYLSFATAKAVPITEVERCLRSHHDLDWGAMDPSCRTKNAQALWSGEGTVTTRFAVVGHELIIQSDRASGETHVRPSDEPVLLA